MKKTTNIKLFEDKDIRTIWDEINEKWYFSVHDVIAILTDQPDYKKVKNYWKWLRGKLNNEGSQLGSNTTQLKLKAADGKFYKTDVMDSEQILRLVQTIPSKRAEPFKLWLAKVGNERIDEMSDPELAINRALDYYKRLGYSDGWVMQRLKSIEIRKELTNEWERGGIKQGLEFAILTDEMYSGWAGLNSREYKKLKGIQKESLRDNMTNVELVLNMLAEVTTSEISKKENPKGMPQHLSVARRGASAATVARQKIELETGKKAITGHNAKSIDKIEKEIRFCLPIGEYWFLSPHSQTPIEMEVDGKIYKFPTAEHYYQAMKFETKDTRFNNILEIEDSNEVRLLTKKPEYRKNRRLDFEKNKFEIMKKAQIAKFLQNKESGELLLSTGDAILIKSCKVCSKCGFGEGSGKNILGKMLMQIRDDLSVTNN